MRYDAAKFWELVDIRGKFECWPWKGYTRPGGHGVWKGSPAHSMALFVQGQAVARGYVVHHLCGSKNCCNVHHLQILRNGDHSRLTREETVAKARDAGS